jgi:hypothetical protein
LFEGAQSLGVIMAWKGAPRCAPTIEKKEEELGEEEEEEKEERRGTPKSLFFGLVEAKKKRK